MHDFGFIIIKYIFLINKKIIKIITFCIYKIITK
jgi:hypothetical protein